MAAIAIATLFAGSTVCAGIAAARRISPAAPPLALGAAVSLALLIILAVDLAALWRFEPIAIALSWAALAGGGVWGFTRLPPERRALNPHTTGVLAVTALAAMTPLLVLPVPMDTDAQGFGMLALAIRDGGNISTLAPWRPDIAYLYSPGALALFAAVSTLAGRVPMSTVMMAVSHACVVIFVWLAWELGEELAHQSPLTRSRASSPATLPAWPWAASVAAAFSVGMWTALFDSHYTAIVGLTLVLGWLVAALRAFRTGRRADVVAAAIVLAAVPLAHADSAVVLAAGMGAFALAGWKGYPVRRWLETLLIPPAVAIALISPWLVTTLPIIRTGIQSPYEVSLGHWRLLVLYQGVIWPLLALVGFVAWRESRPQWTRMMMIWLAIAVDISTLGWIHRLTATVTDPLLRFNYPFSIAWHAPVVPYVALGGGAIAWAIHRAGWNRLPILGGRSVLALLAMSALSVVLRQPVLAMTKGVLPFHGAFSSAADLEAMMWIRDNAPSGARVLNYPGDYENQRDWEAHWAPIITERDCVHFRMQPFFLEAPTPPRNERHSLGLARAFEEQRALLTFWRDPADPSNASLLAEAGIDYVLVPESIADPASLARAWRWQPPARLAGTRSSPDDASYLDLAYTAGGAQVFVVTSSTRAADRTSRHDR